MCNFSNTLRHLTCSAATRFSYVCTCQTLQSVLSNHLGLVQKRAAPSVIKPSKRAGSNCITCTFKVQCSAFGKWICKLAYYVLYLHHWHVLSLVHTYEHDQSMATTYVYTSLDLRCHNGHVRVKRCGTIHHLPQVLFVLIVLLALHVG